MMTDDRGDPGEGWWILADRLDRLELVVADLEDRVAGLGRRGRRRAGDDEPMRDVFLEL